MLKITKYGELVQEMFLEKCRQDGTYQAVFEEHEDGLCLLEPSVKNAADCAALFLLNYEQDTLNVFESWQRESRDNIGWHGDGFKLTYTEIISELKRCIEDAGFQTMYEVDLRHRKSGRSEKCIYSGSNYDEAYKIADSWNREHLADYDTNMSFDNYIDFETDGLSACLYVIETEDDLHGVGKFE